MLSEWLGNASIEEFRRCCLRKQPVARPGTAAPAIPCLGWDTAARLLERAPRCEVFVVSRGRMADEPPPRGGPELRALLGTGWGVVIRKVERLDPELRAMTERFARELPGPATMQIFVTPGGTNGFGWHYDFEDVFIAQTAGIKLYRLRPNTVDLETPVGTNPDFSAVTRERSPMYEVRLEPGDWLYIPSRWWHFAHCEADSLSISIGTFPAGL